MIQFSQIANFEHNLTLVDDVSTNPAEFQWTFAVGLVIMKKEEIVTILLLSVCVT